MFFRKEKIIMNKKLAKLGAASLLAVGAGSMLMKKSRMKSADPEAKTKREKELKEFRNTERGKQAKNSKGIYYSNGNYEAFARPEKPEGVDDKSAYIVGSGLAALAAYTLLVPGCRGAGIAMVLLLVLFLLQRALPAFFESRIWHGMALAAAPLALGFSLLAGQLFDPDHPTATPLLDKLNGLLSGRFEIWHHVFWGYPLYHPEQDGVPGWYHDAMPKAVTLLGGLATDGDEHHAIDNSFLAIPMNKGVLGAVVIGVIFLLLMWRLCQNRCTGETLFLTVILVYFLMENKCFLFSADPFILLLPAALFPAKGKPLPVVCPPVT